TTFGKSATSPAGHGPWPEPHIGDVPADEECGDHKSRPPGAQTGRDDPRAGRHHGPDRPAFPAMLRGQRTGTVRGRRPGVGHTDPAAAHRKGPFSSTPEPHPAAQACGSPATPARTSFT